MDDPEPSSSSTLQRPPRMAIGRGGERRGREGERREGERREGGREEGGGGGEGWEEGREGQKINSTDTA